MSRQARCEVSNRPHIDGGYSRPRSAATAAAIGSSTAFPQGAVFAAPALPCVMGATRAGMWKADNFELAPSEADAELTPQNSSPAAPCGVWRPSAQGTRAPLRAVVAAPCDLLTGRDLPSA